MCWKQEWAAAIGNMETAIAHVERAKAKLQKRLVKREETIKKLTEHPEKVKHSAEMLKIATTLRDKMFKGVLLCDFVIGNLKEQQYQLKNMIEVFGITRDTEAKRTKQLMEGKSAKRMRKSKKWEGHQYGTGGN